jgi:hypothetical protein
MRIAQLLGRVQAFAQRCYETREIATLEAALSQRDADAEDCAAWGLSPGEWFIAVAVALSDRYTQRHAEADAA